MNDDSPTAPRLPLDDHTIALGHHHLAALRAQLNRRTTTPTPPPPPPAPRNEPESGGDLSTDRMLADMAAGAERDRLTARVTQLETEVAQLRAALATILHTAATAVCPHIPADTDSETPPTTSR